MKSRFGFSKENLDISFLEGMMMFRNRNRFFRVRKNKREHGASLLELLVVLAIIGCIVYGAVSLMPSGLGERLLQVQYCMKAMRVSLEKWNELNRYCWDVLDYVIGHDYPSSLDGDGGSPQPALADALLTDPIDDSCIGSPKAREEEPHRHIYSKGFPIKVDANVMECLAPGGNWNEDALYRMTGRGVFGGSVLMFMPSAKVTICDDRTTEKYTNTSSVVFDGVLDDAIKICMPDPAISCSDLKGSVGAPGPCPFLFDPGFHTQVDGPEEGVKRCMRRVEGWKFLINVPISIVQDDIDDWIIVPC